MDSQEIKTYTTTTNRILNILKTIGALKVNTSVEFVVMETYQEFCSYLEFNEANTTFNHMFIGAVVIGEHRCVICIQGLIDAFIDEFSVKPDDIVCMKLFFTLFTILAALKMDAQYYEKEPIDIAYYKSIEIIENNIRFIEDTIGTAIPQDYIDALWINNGNTREENMKCAERYYHRDPLNHFYISLQNYLCSFRPERGVSDFYNKIKDYYQKLKPGYSVHFYAYDIFYNTLIDNGDYIIDPAVTNSIFNKLYQYTNQKVENNHNFKCGFILSDNVLDIKIYS